MNANLDSIKVFKTQYAKYKEVKIWEKKHLEAETEILKKLVSYKNKRKCEFEAGFYFISTALRKTYQTWRFLGLEIPGLSNRLEMFNQILVMNLIVLIKFLK